MKIYNSHDYIINMAKNNSPLLHFNAGDDLESWQKQARVKLSELLGLDNFEKCDDLFKITAEEQTEEYKKISFEFQSEKNYFVPAVMLIPNNAAKPIPAAICLQGHSSGMHISLGSEKFEGDSISIAGGRDFAARAAKEGCCAIAIDQRYMGAAGQDEKGSPACISANESMPALLFGRCAIGERVFDIQRLIDIIKTHFKHVINGEIICMGNSGGGTAAFYASCVDERITLSMPSCAVCTYEDSIMAMYHCPCNFVPGIRKYFNMGDLGCLIAPRKLVLVCGINDPIFPLKGVAESFDIIKGAYKSAGMESVCRIVKGNGGHQFYPDDAWPIVHELLD